MIRIQALEWVQGKIQDILPNNVTTDLHVYDDNEYETFLVETGPVTIMPSFRLKIYQNGR